MKRPRKTTEQNRAFAKHMTETYKSWEDCQEEHMSEILAHYACAREKHPYFCDWVQPSGKTPEEIDEKIAFRISAIRASIVGEAKNGTLGWDDLLNCEVWEVFEALAKGDKTQAVEELYDAVAVLLRTIDVLEGRQKLGKPTKGETK